MRRDNRAKTHSYTSIYITAGVLILAIATFIITFVLYSNKLDKDMYSLDSEYLAQYTTNTTNTENTKTEQASSSIGKKVNEVQNNNTKTENNTNKENDENETKEIANEVKKENKQESNKKEKDPTFSLPIEGELLKEFAKDNLVYSETLKEWTTHLGIDIKAEKATVVKASANGTIKYIKNDPRYGLSIIIEHTNGFQTLYANLLTTEFVSEGEKVKAGQTIATVGESGVYEIVDESHLHFEIIKDNENVNPLDYVKFE